ncbi:citrate lyase subunit beta [Clostridium formicaceticum]|nr:HpcH/HpaI aldolase/citrate lyase family protein [Clostridium formicaceticum]AOY78195.1 citrate lyase subunit beta [Clostridium formicaceticum]
MRYFDDLTYEKKQDIFYSLPGEFQRDSEKDLLAYALGAVLYMPVTREGISEEIIHCKHKGLMSMVLCLEDAVGDHEIQRAEEKLWEHLKILHLAIETGGMDSTKLPLIFVRVRNIEQMERMMMVAGETLCLITGFVFPKFSQYNGEAYFQQLKKLNHHLKIKLYGMPILEAPEIIYKESRIDALNNIKKLLDKYRDLVLNIRIGATDFSGLFGIRRSYDLRIYDIAVIRDCIGDIVNFFCRAEEGHVVSGPVWEYFSKADRILKPQLRQGPFENAYGEKGIKLRAQILDKYLDGLIHEVLLDKANGLTGKTIIHPSHILPVQALQVVSHEEYIDARSILSNNNGQLGVIKSQYANKMNEIKPHIHWAKKIMIKSKIYGVFHERKNFTNLLT